MVELRGVAHFAIPVSEPGRSTRFYTEIVGCKFLHALPDKSMTFLDAGGVCVLLIKRPPPIVRELEGSYGGAPSLHACSGRLSGGRRQPAGQWRRDLPRGRPPGRGHRWSARVFPRSGRHCLGVHQPHSLRREEVNQRFQQRGGRFSLLFFERMP